MLLIFCSCRVVEKVMLVVGKNYLGWVHSCVIAISTDPAEQMFFELL